MNAIEVKPLVTSYGYQQVNFVIDGNGLPEYLNKIKDNLDDSIGEENLHYLNDVEDFSMLCPAFSKALLHEGDKRWVWALAQKDEAILPLYVCEEDLDFSCIVIVADVKKTNDFVLWSRIGFVWHENEKYKEEIYCGILYHEAYTDEDWEKYGSNIALESPESADFWNWVSENWSEELFRRRMNYTSKCYEKEGSVCWFAQPGWVFDRTEYEKMLNDFRAAESKADD